MRFIINVSCGDHANERTKVIQLNNKFDLIAAFVRNHKGVFLERVEAEPFQMEPECLARLLESFGNVKNHHPPLSIPTRWNRNRHIFKTIREAIALSFLQEYKFYSAIRLFRVSH